GPGGQRLAGRVVGLVETAGADEAVEEEDQALAFVPEAPGEVPVVGEAGPGDRLLQAPLHRGDAHPVPSQVWRWRWARAPRIHGCDVSSASSKAAPSASAAASARMKARAVAAATTRARGPSKPLRRPAAGCSHACHRGMLSGPPRIPSTRLICHASSVA